MLQKEVESFLVKPNTSVVADINIFTSISLSIKIVFQFEVDDNDEGFTFIQLYKVLIIYLLSTYSTIFLIKN